MKLELLPKNPVAGSPAIATMETVGESGVQGVVVGGAAYDEAAQIVDSHRPELTKKLEREPNGLELLEAVLAGPHAARVRKV
jgi:hypothetical protein